MAFHKNSIWARNAGCLTDGEKVYDDSSRNEQKRGQQWLMDATEPELFCNKKQAVEAVNSWNISGISNMNDSPCGNISSFASVSGPFLDRLFGTDLKIIHPLSRNIPSASTGNMDMGRKGFEFPFRSDSSFGLSMSHAIADPSFNYSGIRKVKVNEVRDSDNGMPVGMGHFYNRGGYNMISAGSAYNKSDYSNISLGPVYNNGNQNTISMGAYFNKATSNFGSISHTFNQETGNSISMGHTYQKVDRSVLPMGHFYDKGNGNFLSKVQQHGKEDGSIMSMSPAYNKGHEKFISMGPSYSEANGNFCTMGMVYSKHNDDIMSMGPTNDRVETGNVSLCLTYDNEDSSILSMGHNYNKGQNNTVSFGGFHEEPETNSSGRIIGSYDLLMSRSSAQAPEAVCQKDAQASEILCQQDARASGVLGQKDTQASEILGQKDAQTSQVLAQKDAQSSEIPGQQEVQTSEQVLSQKYLARSNADPAASCTPKATSKTDTVSKNKQINTKKDPSSHFPLNVKSLLSTGMFDGVPVKYVSWTREKSVRGVIKGSGYLCSCKDCNGSNCLNAYEFERHANCKTKHPNNHIYFENGKTIYAVVQELKNTPQDKLFEVIQNVTGCPINQKNFQTWKASYQAATVELQRIYGKDGAAGPILK